jgi:hypothetical protein
MRLIGFAAAVAFCATPLAAQTSEHAQSHTGTSPAPSGGEAAQPGKPAGGHAAMAAAAAAGPKRSMIKTSSPADNAMLQGPPEAFEVTFVHPMKLTSITLTDDTDSDVPVTAAPVQTGTDSSRIALPKLDPGTYKLHWVGVGGSGREMKGELSFMVH